MAEPSTGRDRISFWAMSGRGSGSGSTRSLQTVLSITLPTSTGPEGYGRGVPSAAILNTLEAQLTPRLIYEGSVGVGRHPDAWPPGRSPEDRHAGGQLGPAPSPLGEPVALREPVLSFSVLPRHHACRRSTGGSFRWTSAGCCRRGVGESGGLGSPKTSSPEGRGWIWSFGLGRTF